MRNTTSCCCWPPPWFARGGQQFDVVVYGATAGGTIAAIAAAKEGVRVALLEPGRHVGGMLSGGLGRTDMDRQENVIGGLSREFFERAGKHYGQPISWLFEPSVAERILNDWLKEAGVQVMFNQRLAAADKRAGRIVRLRTTAGRGIRGRRLHRQQLRRRPDESGGRIVCGRPRLPVALRRVSGGQAGFPAGQPSASRGSAGDAARTASCFLTSSRRKRSRTPERAAVSFSRTAFGICLTRNPANRSAAAAARRLRCRAIRTGARLSRGAGRLRAPRRFHRHFAPAERQDRYQQRRGGIDESAGRELGLSRRELRTAAGDLARASDVGAGAALLSRQRPRGARSGSARR